MNQDGSPDTVFNENGYVKIQIPYLEKLQSVIYNNNFYYVIGVRDDRELSVHRLTENGQIDTQFGNDGLFVQPLNEVLFYNFYFRLHFTMDSQDNLYVGGNVDEPNSYVIIYKIDFDGIVSVKGNSEIVNDYELSQNYPNPFNPETTIRFSLPGAGNVKIVVYNMLGEEVAILLDGVLSAGTHELNFNGSSLTSGVYFYKIEAGNFRAVKKMLLLK